MTSRKKPIRAHGAGWATHNGAKVPGELEVTIWGTADDKPDREVALVLTEEAAKQLIWNLTVRYGISA